MSGTGSASSGHRLGRPRCHHANENCSLFQPISRNFTSFDCSKRPCPHGKHLHRTPENFPEGPEPKLEPWIDFNFGKLWPLDHSTPYHRSWHLQETTAAKAGFLPVQSSPGCRCKRVGPASPWSRARGWLDGDSRCHAQDTSRQRSRPCQTGSTTLNTLNSLPLSSDSKSILSAP